jgi:hypothetical protein
MNISLIQKRFIELQDSSSSIKITEPDSSGAQYVDFPSYMKWITNVQNLIIQVFGENSPHYVNLLKITDKFRRRASEFEAVKSIFMAAKEDYEGGYLFDLEKSISGEILGDLISLAKLTLKDNNKDVAAVLASAALEDALKRYASKNDLDVNNKVMQDVVNALKSKGLVGGAQKGLLDTMPKIRDYSMHANWDKIKPEDVSSIIGFVEQFLLSKF